MAKRRPVTIQDLIEALEKAEAHEKKMERARARQPKKNVLPFKNAKEALATAHQDDFERDVSLAQRLLELAWASDEPPGLEVFAGEMDQVSAFLSVLFLAAKGKVSVDQEEFYGKVVIRQGDPSVLQDAAGPRERFVPKKREKKKKAPEGEEGAAADAEGAADGEGAAVAEGGAGDPVVEGGVAPEAAEARAGREAAPTPLPTAVHQQTMFEIPASADADAEKEET